MNEDVNKMLHNKFVRRMHYVAAPKQGFYRKKPVAQYERDERDERVQSMRKQMSY